MTQIIKEKELYGRLDVVISQGWHDIPATGGYGGSGGPGKLLEHLLGLDGGNSDTPDGGKWEIKFHGGSSPLTLFHKEGQPKCYIDAMVKHYGWPDKMDRISFRHTLWGQSSMGFKVECERDQVILTNKTNPMNMLPYWSKDTLRNAFIGKLRRLILVKGKKKGQQVTYESAVLFSEPKSEDFIKGLEQGVVAIDFDARSKKPNPDVDGWSIRNHGTKFRIKVIDLPKIYDHFKIFGEG